MLKIHFFIFETHPIPTQTQAAVQRTCKKTSKDPVLMRLFKIHASANGVEFVVLSGHAAENPDLDFSSSSSSTPAGLPLSSPSPSLSADPPSPNAYFSSGVAFDLVTCRGSTMAFGGADDVDMTSCACARVLGIRILALGAVSGGAADIADLPGSLWLVKAAVK